MCKYFITILWLTYFSVIWGTNHYVDKNANGSNNGTSWTNAWQSLSAINWSSIQPGDFIYFSGGTDSTVYNENLTVAASGNTNNLIVIRPGLEYGHNGRVIIAGGTSGTNITIQNRKYVRLEKLEVTMARGTTQGIYLRGTSPGALNVIYVDSCSVISRTSTSENWCMRIDGYNSGGLTTYGDSIFVRNGYYENTRTTPIGVQCDAVIAQHVQNVFIIGNKILVKNDWPTAPAPTHNDCFSTDNGVENLTIANNILINLQTVNVQSQAVILGGLKGFLKFYNNVVYGHFQHLNGYWPQTMSIYSSSSPCDYYIYSNTFQGGSNSYVLMMETGSNSNVWLKNNIFDGYSGNAVRVHFRSSSPTYSQIDGNLYGDLSDANNAIMATPEGSLSMANLNSRGAETGGQPNNRWNVEPKFTDENNFDFSLQATSPAINQGVTLSAPYNTDLLGISRPQGAGYDIAAYEFTTGGGGNNPPYQPTNPNPANGSINQPVNLTMTWSCTDPNGDPLTYDVYFGTNSNPPIASTNQSNTSFNPGQLNNSTTYYWKIVAKDNQGATTSGPVWNFSTEAASGGNNPPNQPANPNPPNGASDQPVNLTLTWSCTDPDGDPLTYDIYFGTSNNPPLALANQSNTSFNPGQLNNSSIYYWKIVAKDNQGANTSGPVWNFTTIFVDVTPPEVVSAELLDSITLSIVFSEPLEQTSAENLNNYSIINNVNVTAASLSGATVTLTTSPHSPGTYIVTVNNVTDLAGNIISPTANSASYEWITNPQNLIKLEITAVKASSTADPNYPPEKTIDGLGIYQDPDSRWATIPMPQYLIFDLGSITEFEQTRFSFYAFESGRIYTYSVFVTNDTNTTWTPVLDQFQSVLDEWTIENFSPTSARFVKLLFITSNQSTAGQEWAHIWEAEIWGLDMITSDENHNEIPIEFHLSQNYPNPFNPITTIDYSVPKVSWINLVVYNTIGQKVAVLVNEEKQIGSYKIDFNASELTSGIYFYMIKSGDFVETRKMVLLK